LPFSRSGTSRLADEVGVLGAGDEFAVAFAGDHQMIVGMGGIHGNFLRVGGEGDTSRGRSIGYVLGATSLQQAICGMYHLVRYPYGTIMFMGRQELLHDVVAHVRHHGIADSSLRELADLVGSSHRMLLYHFGSREGLIAAIVAENEADERATAAANASRGLSGIDALRAAWKRLRQPARSGDERLFFELAAMAMYHRPGTERVGDDLVGRWMALAEDTGADVAQLRLDIAVIRGLLLDLLVTGDRERTNDAFERYLQLRI
jgi:AcrR family transcriptional regulator